MAAKLQPYAEQGVTLSKSTLYPDSEVTLTYGGLLVRHGALEVCAHIGYGDDWTEKGFIPMEKSDKGFTCSFKVLLPGTLNICFKDSADNWDNNSQDNYSFKVSKKAARSTKTTAGKDECEQNAEKKTKAKTKAASKAETKKSPVKAKSVKKPKGE